MRASVMRAECPLLITCEHGGNQVPAEYRTLFSTPGAVRMLGSHRGYDPGALDAANQFAEALGAELIASETTRLLVDLNRSQDNPDIFWQGTSHLTDAEKLQLLQTWYLPYRERVEDAVRRQIALSGRIIHLSIHTFTPRFRGTWRPIDVGLLFDPARTSEKAFCKAWLRGMAGHQPGMRAVANQPYAGIDDGFTTALRRLFADATYAGIEVEINHRYWKRSVQHQRKVVQALLETIPLG
jgi:predicted N-formylglutamate amidohydrolase